MRSGSVQKHIDWITILLYLLLVVAGWVNIYSTSLPNEDASIFDFSQIYGRQLVFILTCIPLIILILALDTKFYEKYALIFYILGILSILGLFVFGKSVKGQTNWYQIGGLGIQPSEFVKTTTALLLAKYFSDNQGTLKTLKEQVTAFIIIGVPTLLILKHDTGSAMLFASLVFVLFREGLPSWYLWTGFITILLFIAALVVKPSLIITTIAVLTLLHYYFNKNINRNPFIYLILATVMCGFVLSVDYVYDNVLEPHQKDRINVLLGEDVDLQAEGYNLNQSKIAIGSGGWYGTGFLQGTQTKGGFVPEQHTDYIFTTVGEEWGFVGSSTIIVLFLCLFFRLIYLAEKQKKRFNKVYGYCVVSFLFIHFAFNISMLVGLFPTIGVPLPFFSYGGSSLIAFTLLLFIFLKLDANRINEW
ncbi:rod shape-determining protein RodA [Myroides sp. WP-1]|uniref:rod shape-determining protein RodA n=1 Tax=Myroides sp. WP-1 TaxID=2759944 RepID=UPI0015F89B11|nr:rod shape-determining protein RodA [Myroides sp. WP-1]MBB1138401.1 rod shape-determining protein RodA [Myroides sp. WP-1]